MSSTFVSVPATPQTLRPDPSKHVNFTLGMLLGVDDFRQEFAYLSGHTEWLARDAVGYGTLNGLAVLVTPTARGPRVEVTAGSALLPNGKLVCVRPAQCAYLNDWLAANQAEALATILSPPSALPLYLTLCYRECPVDSVPIPGEPCRTEGELFAPSRLVDDFALAFRTAAPRQLEEDGIRELATWLDSLITVHDSAPAIDLDALAAGVVAALPSPEVVSTTGMALPIGSPITPFVVPAGQLPDLMRVLLRIWVTRIRPLLHPVCGGGSACCGGTSTAPAWDDCLLLARVDVPIVNVGPGVNLRVDDTLAVTLDESARPILVQQRVLQELSPRTAFLST